MTPNSFMKSPIYLYWDNLPIEKVKFQLSGTYPLTFIFNGRGTTSTSWFHQANAISNSLGAHSLSTTYTFNNNFSYPDFYITSTEARIQAKRLSGIDEKYDIYFKKDGIKTLVETLVISVTLYY
ncbi:uncharacterized protein LOC118761433 [Octopus sinensis]|uniref:Uncharacterized protein LOC118761432 n=1 Tax=Octopus sinensis TaxID=2607531 RepID=A0A7E6EIP7_9MOLL|nr:uncharacterized protein LOC118761432 [Octopus sinensis]XP_036355199.1 uncharacterized protein LOC118761433 [Octopus sinensis]